jgi:6-phosphogluconolactonase
MNTNQTSSVERLTFASPDALAHAAASAWLDEIEAARQAGVRHCVALSGGRITQKFLARTVELAGKRGVSFAPVHFFWADERCVPPTDADSNYRLANEFFFQKLPEISPAQIHRLVGEQIAKEAVGMAEEELRRIGAPGKNGQPVLDLIFLGMGEDGHVASLFPNAGQEVWDCPVSFLAVENAPKPPPRRITLSFRALVGARQVWTLVSGAGKDTALRESLQPGGRTPLGRVLQARSTTKIFADFNL